MAIAHLLTDASAIMTVVSFITFIGILWWAFSSRRNADFDIAAQLPFVDDTSGADDAGLPNPEKHHG
ncbi:cbb3-type cytochrome oxidase subunit 3 [Paraherbaspirillum soli]|uniref:Cbb3-type cytochrome oxidase subunit 3 n=1 Tax=Paraherbaspirillum soli TaxID=631222 RepID=A0ABW0MC04_9BURK